MSGAPTVVCPATRLLHRSDEYELVVPKKLARGVRFICDNCHFTWTASDAEVQRLLFHAAAIPPENRR